MPCYIQISNVSREYFQRPAEQELIWLILAIYRCISCKRLGLVKLSNVFSKCCIVVGGMLAGHDQSDGELIERNGQKLKEFYGMSSKTAMEKHVGGVAEYRASEGKAVTVPYKLVILSRVSPLKARSVNNELREVQ